jgi:hypothetical protein
MSAVDTDTIDCHRMALRGRCREAGPWCQQKWGLLCSQTDQGPLLFRYMIADFFSGVAVNVERPLLHSYNTEVDASGACRLKPDGKPQIFFALATTVAPGSVSMNRISRPSWTAVDNSYAATGMCSVRLLAVLEGLGGEKVVEPVSVMPSCSISSASAPFCIASWTSFCCIDA